MPKKDKRSKAKAKKKPRPDASQTALAMVEKIIGEKLKERKY
jgi:hypothetical protein